MHGLGKYIKKGKEVFRFYKFGHLKESVEEDPNGQWKKMTE